MIKVSNFVEDISDGEKNDLHSDPPSEEETKKPSLQLQSSDFDFLEQITSKSVTGNSVYKAKEI